MLCSRFKQIIFTKSSFNHNVHIRCMIASRFITKRCLRIEEIYLSLAKNDSLDLRSMAAFKHILKDLNVRRLWSVWTRSQIVNTVVRRCKRERSVKEVLLRFRQAILRPRRTLLLSATAAFRTHGDDGTPIPCENITDDEIQALLSDLAGVDELSKSTLYCTSCGKRLVIDKKHPGVRYCICKDSQVPEESADGWVPYMEAEDVIIWRKEYKPGHGLYAYKVYGRYKEVVAGDFAAVQVDASYRRAWDENVASLSVVEADANGRSDQAVLHWEVQWPKLFANRDYVYIRRHRQFPAGPQYSPHKDRIFQTEGPDDTSVSQQMGPERLSVHSHAKRKGLEADMVARSRSSPQTDKVFVIVSRACEHPLAPETKHAVRVNEYWSHMVVKSTDGAEQAGMEFVLTYYDEPAVGGMAGGVAAWASGRAAPAYLTKMRRAAAHYDQWKHTQESSDGTSIADVVTFASEQQEPVAPNVGLTQSSSSPSELEEARRDQSTQTDAHAPTNTSNDTPQLLDKGVGTSDNGHKVSSSPPEPKAQEEGEKSEEEDKNGWWRYLYPFYYFV